MKVDIAQKKSWVKTFFLPLLLIALSLPAAASFISLNTALSSKVAGKNLQVLVSSVNKGDESAFNVQAEIRVPGKTLLSEKKTELPVNGYYQVTAQGPLNLVKPGTYPLILVMNYTDANQYPFSALTAKTFILGKETPAALFGQIRPVTFSKEGTLRLKIKNLGPLAIQARVWLVIPRELTAARDSQSFSVASKGEANLAFPVNNFSALDGSTYQVFAVCEYDEGGEHFTSIAPGTIKIVAAKEIFGLSYPLIFSLLGILLIIFVGAQFFRKK